MSKAIEYADRFNDVSDWYEFDARFWFPLAATELRRLDALVAQQAQEIEALKAQRVPLTEDDIADIAERMEASDPSDSFWREFARAIEAAHGIYGGK